MLENQSVKEIQNNIKSRQISIKEVVEYYLDRIEKFNPDLNAIVLQKDRELIIKEAIEKDNICLLYTSPSPRDRTRSRMPSSA